MKLFRKLLTGIIILPCISFAQADNEIQVYASPTVGKNLTIFELHSNYTFKGIKNLPDPKSAHYLNESLEITHGFGDNFEMGIYIFTTITPTGKYEYLETISGPGLQFLNHGNGRSAPACRRNLASSGREVINLLNGKVKFAR